MVLREPGGEIPPGYSPIKKAIDDSHGTCGCQPVHTQLLH
jgi:hypothetical protein